MAAPPPSRLDANQVLQGSFDESSGRLRTDSLSTIVNADIDVALDPSEDGVYVADKNSGALMTVESDGSINVNSVDGALEATQQQVLTQLQAANSSLDAIEFNTNVQLSSRATEQTQLDNRDQLEIINTKLDLQNLKLDAIDSNLDLKATEATQLEVKQTFIDQTSNKISTLNSTSTPLLAGAAFVGAWEDCSQYSMLSITIKADVNSSANGAKLEFSHDGITIIRDVSTTFVASGNGVYFSIPIEASYFRINFTNGATPQGSFLISTIISRQPTGIASVPLASTINDLTTALLTRSIITGKSVDGVYTAQRASGISSGNSTSTLLGSNATFTGTWEDVLGYANVAITVNAAQASATNGLSIEFSTNGVDIDDGDVFSIPAGGGNQFSFGVIARYFRVRYTNGAAAQTAFRLSTMYHISAIKPSSHRIGDVITQENDAELTKSVLTAQQPNGNFTPIDATTAGNLKMSVQEFDTAALDWQAGNIASRTQRVVLATNQPAVAISAAALPLPSGAATSANQTTGNTSLSSIDTKLTTTNNYVSPILDFGAASNLGSTLNSAVTLTNTNGYNSISFYLTIPTGATVVFEGNVDGVTWTSCTLRQKGGDNYITSTSQSGEVVGSIAGLREFRVRVSVAGSANGTVMGRATRDVCTLEGIENGPPNEFFFDTSRGKIGGINGTTRFARNPDIDMVKETIWALGGTYTFSTVAASYYISSTSASDTQVITVTVLDGNYVPTTRTVTLAGQTKTLIPGGTILRINGAANTGTTDLTGNVYIYEDDTVVLGVPQTATKIRNYIPLIEQNSGIGVYTVAAGQTAYLVKWQAQCSTGTADVSMDVRQFGSVFRNRGRKLIAPVGSSEYKIFLRIPEKSDIKFEASTSANNTTVLVEYDLILADN